MLHELVRYLETLLVESEVQREARIDFEVR